MPALALKLLYFVTALIPEKKSKANPQQGPGFGLCILKLRNTYVQGSKVAVKRCSCEMPLVCKICSLTIESDRET